LVAAGRVKVAGVVASKPATQVESSAALLVNDEEANPPGRTYASRGATKLLGALDTFMPEGLTVAGRRCLDAGASTGGFTDVLLRRGAAQVIAVDVGYGQLAWRLQSDPRVVVRDRTNVRDLTIEHTGALVDLVVADLSFISLRLVLPALFAVTTADADLVVMVKPQFEVGKQRLPSGGVVREADLRRDAVVGVIGAAVRIGLALRGVTASPLPGPSGNVEYFLWLHRDAQPPEDAGPAERAADVTADVVAQVDRAIREGPT
jgi:23S rRNA (cytidine1920-2'-O)/16S rRNA (cytidine1409-2'-O)-methyltransferase